MFDDDFKKALQMLPNKEKDKLILRLLRRDLKLAQRLHFELIDTDSVTDKRAKIKKEIIRNIQEASKRYYSPGYLLMDMREISGKITEHVDTTKDKSGEIILNCLMIRGLLEQNNEHIAKAKRDKAQTFCVYIIARMFKILILIQKQHSDLHIEFRDDIQAIGQLISKNDNLMQTAIHHGLDVNWLIQFEIPEDIEDIHKNLRKHGFLK